MSKYDGGAAPKVVNHDVLKEMMEYHGWTCETGGKHTTKMVKNGCRPVTIPRHQGKDFGPQLRRRILRQAELIAAEEG